MLYRLAYADAQQLQPYALARWSMPPAQLVRQRLRDALGQRGPVLNVGDGNVPLVLAGRAGRIQPTVRARLIASTGLVRLRATLTRNEALLGQRMLCHAAASASTADAGGRRACPHWQPPTRRWTKSMPGSRKACRLRAKHYGGQCLHRPGLGHAAGARWA